MTDLAAILDLPSEADQKRVNEQSNSEMQEMLASVDLLGLVQSDTGENGRRSGNRIDFNNCPICHHHGCFSFYIDSNSWHCFGDSNPTGYRGGTALEYYKATRADNDTEAVKWLREQTGHPFRGSPHNDGQDAPNNRWLIVDTDIDHMPEPAPELIKGLLRIGRKGIISGASKSHKSWLALNLAISVATGREWLGFECRKGRVLYLNMEIAADYFPRRIAAVANAKGVANQELTNLKRIDMRGFYSGMDALKAVILSQVTRDSYALLILDPLYKAFNGDENKASEVGDFCKAVDQICEATGCAFVYVHHHSKGAKGDVASIDRASGSGVFARDPDMILDVTRIEPTNDDDDALSEDERAYQLSFDLREFVSPSPINVIYRNYLHHVDTDGLTAEWKPRSASGRNRGGKKTAELNKARSSEKDAWLIAKLAASYYAQQVDENGLLLKDAADLVGCDSRALAKAIDATDLFELVQVTQRKRYVVAANVPNASTEPLDL